jgi:DNA-binding transcriptional ArsR family regulator
VVDPEGKDTREAKRAYEAQMVRSAAHPLRVKALSMMAERPSSPKEIAKAVGKPIGNVAYHVQALEKAGMALLVEEKKRGGAVEHFYIATTILDEESENLSADQRRMLSQITLQRVIVDAASAIETGTWETRLDNHLSRVPLYLDEEGWREMTDIYNGCLAAVLDAQARCAERLDREGKAGFSAMAAMLLFEMSGEPERD